MSLLRTFYLSTLLAPPTGLDVYLFTATTTNLDLESFSTSPYLTVRGCTVR